VQARGIGRHEPHAAEQEEQEGDEYELVRERLIFLDWRLQPLPQQARIDARHVKPTNDGDGDHLAEINYWLRVFDFGCSAKYSVGRVDMRNPRRTPITVGNRMFG
jgi:hypothetical protein